MTLPNTLISKINLWREAGFIHREHEELFTELGWFQVFVGQGVSAQDYNPMAESVLEQLSYAIYSVARRLHLSKKSGKCPAYRCLTRYRSILPWPRLN